MIHFLLCLTDKAGNLAYLERLISHYLGMVLGNSAATPEVPTRMGSSTRLSSVQTRCCPGYFLSVYWEMMLANPWEEMV